MGRRKQGVSPKKNWGLVEHRQEGHAPQTLPPLPVEELPPWLQDNPDDKPVAKKRRKIKSETEPIVVPPIDSAILTIGTIDMAMAGDAAVHNAHTLKLSTESIPGSNSLVHTLLMEADDDNADCVIAVCGLSRCVTQHAPKAQ